MSTNSTCHECGAAIPPDAPLGLCPQCLLNSEAKTLVGDGEPGPARKLGAGPVVGADFGGYRILRLLGRGGMGEVYEAEQLPTGRRVALKVMNRALGSEQDEKRFLREGRLAAAINHPNVVYVHGSEEIEGAPAIAMELVEGGTLKDRLKREGPLPVAEAVEAILQIVAGLETAQSAGVLHRDIKPTNCFVDADGTVKVGDFGLSVSTLARGESLLTVSGSVLGTPAYASPEQLKGQELEVTSDIYSVGATLFHLLTGKPPFGAADFVKLITEVLDQPAPSPRISRAEIPEALARVVVRCLAKDPKARFPTYAALRDALLPFRRAEVTPAHPARRVLAGLIDDTIGYAPTLLFLIYWNFDPLDFFVRDRDARSAAVWLGFYSWYVLYYTVTEGWWGAGLGKTLLGLRVIDRKRESPGLRRAFFRTLIYLSPAVVPSLVYVFMVSSEEVKRALAADEVLITDKLWLVLMVLLFVTMRARNGYAAVHDLLTRTRVIVRARSEPRPALAEYLDLFAAPLPVPPAETSPALASRQIGPYEVLEPLWQRAGEELFLGFDPVLQRRIWIHVRPLEAGAPNGERQRLSRPARLRWLNGAAEDRFRWDAYEALEGRPLAALVRPVPWGPLRYWLLDLAGELSAQLDDPVTALPAGLDRMWITSTGRLFALEFTAPGTVAPAQAPSVLQPVSDVGAMQKVLERTAAFALGEARESSPRCDCLPLAAHDFLGRLRTGVFDNAGFVVGNLHSLLNKPAEISRSWRAASLSLVPAIVLGLSLLAAGMVSFDRIRWEQAWAASFPGLPSLRPAAAVYLEMIDGPDPARRIQRLFGARHAGKNGAHAAESPEALKMRAYLAANFGFLATNQVFWNDLDLVGMYGEEERQNLLQALSGAQSGELGPVDLAQIERRIRGREKEERIEPMIIWVAAGISLAALVALLELVACLLGVVPSLRLFAITVLDRDCRPASRGRHLLRWSLVWMPLGLIGGGGMVAALAGFAAGTRLFELGAGELPAVRWLMGVIAASCGLVVVGIFFEAVRHPARSIADRLARTQLTPR